MRRGGWECGECGAWWPNAVPTCIDCLTHELDEAKRRMHLILTAVIYSTHGYLLPDGEIDTAAKFRAIERLARLDWDAEGVSRVV